MSSRAKCTGAIQSQLTEVRCCAVQPQLRLLAVGSGNSRLEVWDLDHLDVPSAASNVNAGCGIEVCKFSADGETLFTAGESNEVDLWDSRTLRHLETFKAPARNAPPRYLEVSRDGKYLMVGDKFGCVSVWDIHSRSLVRVLAVTPGRYQPLDFIIEAVLILPGDREIVVVTGGHGISVWNIVTGTCTIHWPGDPLPLSCAALSANAEYLLTGDRAGNVTTWEIATGRPIKSKRIHRSWVQSVACNADATFLISGDFQGEIRCEAN
jgi:WD40 repeat protein